MCVCVCVCVCVCGFFLEDDISSRVLKFADDTKVYRKFKN